MAEAAGAMTKVFRNHGAAASCGGFAAVAGIPMNWPVQPLYPPVVVLLCRSALPKMPMLKLALLARLSACRDEQNREPWD